MKNKVMYSLASALIVLSLTGCGKEDNVKEENSKTDNNKTVEINENVVYTNSKIALYLDDEIDASTGVAKKYSKLVDGELEEVPEGEEVTLESGSYSKNPSDLLTKAKVYIKHIIEDNKIDTSYGCIKEDGKDELCVMAYKVKENANNKAKMEKYFEGEEDTCFAEEEDFECDNGSIVISNNEDVVYTYDYSTKLACTIDFELGASCSIMEDEE